MNIKQELKGIIAFIEANETIGHDDAGENGARMVALEDFNPTAEDSGARDDDDFEEKEIFYNGWLEKLKHLYNSL